GNPCTHRPAQTPCRGRLLPLCPQSHVRGAPGRDLRPGLVAGPAIRICLWCDRLGDHRGLCEGLRGTHAGKDVWARIRRIPAPCARLDSSSLAVAVSRLNPLGIDDIAAEQQTLSMLYGLLDSMRERARQRLREALLTPAGGTHQARSERDASATRYADQIARW